MSNNISVSTATVQSALLEFKNKVNFVVVPNSKKTVIDLVDDNKEFLLFLQRECFLTNVQNAKVIKWLGITQDLNKVSAKSVNELFNQISFIFFADDPQIEIKIVNKWYPVKATINKWKHASGNGHVMQLTYFAKLGALNYSNSLYVLESSFIDDNDKKVARSFDDIFLKYGVRVASKESIEKAKNLNNKIISLSNEAGKVYDAWGTGLTFHDFWGFADINIGWKESPTMTIIEPLLENRMAHHEVNVNSEWNLPFVRAFSLKHKAYVYVDVESIQPHVYQREGKDKIVLPPAMFTALDSIFNAKRENIFGDLFHGRHGGIVVLANGPSGVGKTLTAEVFAEYQERPLYSMEMSEIGTSVKEVEANLQRIFARAKKWNAVLLFDEADIFLSEREASDLERSAIVGIFLRLLDYYEGTFFLTTNRGEGIDKAFKSRVTLYLNYPELSVTTREKIWYSMLSASGIEVEVDTSWTGLAQAPLNGRQIRNQVRLLKLMYPNNKIKISDIVKSLEFTAV